MKAQIEIMGLAIIVILVTLGLFFSIAFKQPKTESPITQVYGDQKLASDFLITFLESYSADPCHATMRDLALDCARYTASGSGKYFCDELNSCNYLQQELNVILDGTLNKWGYSYTLRYLYEHDEITETLLEIDDTDCTAGKPRQAPGIQPISLGFTLSGSAYFRLDICS